MPSPSITTILVDGQAVNKASLRSWGTSVEGELVASATDADLAAEATARTAADNSEATARIAGDADKALKTRTIGVAGLATGGGDLTADRTITVPAATDAEAITGTVIAKAMTPAADKAALNARVGPIEARTITAAGLAVGGGSLSADRTITVPVATDAEAINGASAAKAMTPASDKAALDARVGPLETRTITAAGLAVGGGSLSADRTITVPVATDGEAVNGVATTKAMTPAADKAALNARVGPVETDVSALETGLASETSNRASAITAEASARTTAINTEASARTTAITAETSARTTAINAEATARTDADNALDALIDIETAARISADIGLDALINAEIAARATALAGKADKQTPINTQHRPGDVIQRFTTTLTGPAVDAAALSDSLIVVNDGGNVVRVAGVAVVALRERAAVEAGRQYRVRYVVRRFTDPSDPAGDTVKLGIQWLNKDKAVVSQRVVENISLIAANGRHVKGAIFSDATGPDIAFVWPATARYMVPFVQTYGVDGITDIEVIEWADVTDLDPSTIQGSSNYDLWLAAGNTGTLADYLAFGENTLQPIADDARDSADEAALDAAAAEASRVAALASENAAELAETGSEAAQSGTIAAISGAGGSLGNVTLEAATRVVLAALNTTLGLTAQLTEAGRTGLFEFVTGDHSALVTLDTQQGFYVAPSSDTTGATGAWVRRFNGPVNPRWFGVTPGNDSAAFGAANSTSIAACLAMVGTAGPYRVQFPYGIYWFASSIDLASGNIIFEGAGAGIGGSSGNVRLAFPAGVTGIRVQNNLSSGDLVKDAVSHASGAGSIIRNLTLKGAFTATEAEAHGIRLRTNASIEHCTINGFEGDGIHCWASNGAASGASPPFGNCNVCRIDYVIVRDCRDGISWNGSDANASTITDLDAAECRRWAIRESGVLGNSYFGGHSANNGTTAFNDGIAIGASIVSHLGNQYFAIAGQEVGASTNAPTGTTLDNTWWAYLQAGGVNTGRPAWTSGMLVRAGGHIFCDEAGARNVFSGFYTEGGGGKSQLAQRDLVIGGVASGQVYTGNTASGKTPSVIQPDTQGVLIFMPKAQFQSGTVTVDIGEVQGNVDRKALVMKETTVAPLGYGYRFDASKLDMFLSYDSSAALANIAFRISGPTTAQQFGTGAAVPHAIYVPRLMIGDTETNARQITNGIVSPTSGNWGRGSLILQRNATAGGSPGWMTTTGGVGGSTAVFKALANLAA